MTKELCEAFERATAVMEKVVVSAGRAPTPPAMEQREQAAADLCERLAQALRTGKPALLGELLQLVLDILSEDDPVRLYRRALLILGPMVVDEAALDAAVRAVFPEGRS